MSVTEVVRDQGEQVAAVVELNLMLASVAVVLVVAVSVEDRTRT